MHGEYFVKLSAFKDTSLLFMIVYFQQDTNYMNVSLVLSSLVLSCPVLSCLVLSSLVLSEQFRFRFRAFPNSQDEVDPSTLYLGVRGLSF
jgi:hypothetical protein